MLGTCFCWGHGWEALPLGTEPGGSFASLDWELLVSAGMVTAFSAAGKDPERYKGAFNLVSSLWAPLILSQRGKFEVENRKGGGTTEGEDEHPR